MANILALDQSSLITGWAVFTSSGKLLKHGKIVFASTTALPARLVKLSQQIENLIDQYKIDEVVFEDIQLQANRGNNVKTFKILAEVFGVISELVAKKGLPQTAVLASVWKAGLGIKGADRTAQKRNAASWVKTTYEVSPTQDEADAICIGSYHIKHNGILADEGFDWAD